MQNISNCSNITCWYYICVPSNWKREINESKQKNKSPDRPEMITERRRSTTRTCQKFDLYCMNIFPLLVSKKFATVRCPEASYCFWTCLASKRQKSIVNLSKLSHLYKIHHTSSNYAIPKNK